MSKLHSGLYESADHTWKTPSNLIVSILGGLGIEKFDIDVAASCCHVPAHRYFTQNGIAVEEGGHLDQIELGDGLEAEWRGICWMNPPYGNLLKKFVEKAHFEATKHIKAGLESMLNERLSEFYKYKNTESTRPSTEIIAILPMNRLETSYYHKFILEPFLTSIFIFEGKLSFEKTSKGLLESIEITEKQKYNTAPFAVGLVFWNVNKSKRQNIINCLEKNGYKGTFIKESR